MWCFQKKFIYKSAHHPDFVFVAAISIAGILLSIFLRSVNPPN